MKKIVNKELLCNGGSNVDSELVQVTMNQTSGLVVLDCCDLG